MPILKCLPKLETSLKSIEDSTRWDGKSERDVKVDKDKEFKLNKCDKENKDKPRK
jgi:hypothetical protein